MVVMRRLLTCDGQVYSTAWIQLLEDWVVEQMHIARIPSIRKSSVAEGIIVEGILEKWSELKPVRDEWMDEDPTTWIGANRLYPGVPDALKFASSTIYIVTTKQELQYRLKEYLVLEVVIGVQFTEGEGGGSYNSQDSILELSISLFSVAEGKIFGAKSPDSTN
ncbi:hypothetical protein GBA52_006650 [Prunus armeniaca]|nr:hypothetical protein GBA52_006650 [Prunus armeniaca]